MLVPKWLLNECGEWFSMPMCPSPYFSSLAFSSLGRRGSASKRRDKGDVIRI